MTKIADPEKGAHKGTLQCNKPAKRPRPQVFYFTKDCLDSEGCFRGFKQGRNRVQPHGFPYDFGEYVPLRERSKLARKFVTL